MVDVTAIEPTSGCIDSAGIHHLPIRVYYEDTDAAGIVYYANYLKFIERARTDMMRLLGVTHSHMASHDALSFIVRSCAVKYRKPARLDDGLDIRTRIQRIRGPVLDVLQDVHRDDDLLVSTDLRIACMDGEGRVQSLPSRISAAFGRIAQPVSAF
ncbi:MAG: tol-pal system-associated acyl-CoA thioesterase [Proteobacteria bacterium]|nr:tol-pal system-associated acyl-CoA thioesterase [Pseudomonadota bacterium]MDA1058963.1 tol-pal system-associated acyl-CoA thioesterase [Pseudomonadota bacterium]